MGTDRSSKLNGRFGFVIIPDLETRRRAIRLTDGLGNEPIYKVKAPIIVLFSCPVLNAPASLVAIALKCIRRYEGYQFRMQRVEAYGEKSLVWNAVPDDVLRDMQHLCLPFGRYRDRDSPSRTEEEKLTLSIGEETCERETGYPFMDQFRIELAYSPKGFSADRYGKAKQQSEAIGISFVEMGPFGSAKETVSLEP